MLIRPLNPQENLGRLREGKRRMKELCMRVALENTPATVELVVFNRRLSGKADCCGKVLIVPKPYTRRALHTFLHECGHIAVGHFNGNHQPDYMAEFEAERWATERMCAAGIPVSRKDIQGGKRYVSGKIWRALYDGLPVDPQVRRWAVSGVQKEKWKDALRRIRNHRREVLKNIGQGPMFL
jgi:hypothetical protein